MADEETRPHRARHARGRAGAGAGAGRRGRGALVAALAAAAVVLLGVGVGIGLLVAPRNGAAASGSSGTDAASPGPARPAASSAEEPPSHPTLLGRVVRVGTGDTVEVDVGGRRAEVSVLGVRAPALAGPGRSEECGGRAALEFADSRLSGQMVTLVPDPTLPELDDQGRRLAYVVLSSQLSYTDAAVTAGVARADTSRRLWYAPVFQGEQAQAVAARRGIWGEPCRARP